MGTGASCCPCRPRVPKARKVVVRPLETSYTRHRRKFSVHSWRSIPKSLDHARGPPYKERVSVCNSIRKDIQSGDFVGLPRDIQRLRYICGLDHEVDDESGVSLALDNTTIQMILTLTRLVNLKLNHWNTDAIELCKRLKDHLSPPRGLKKRRKLEQLATCTDLTELDVSGMDVHKEKNLKILHSIIKENKDLVIIKMNFTKVENNHIEDLLHAMARLKKLNYVGLAGNRLCKKIIEKLQLMLNRKCSFPVLMWIDLRNNKDIFSIPNRIQQLLKTRWPTGQKPYFDKLADGAPLNIEAELIDLEDV